MPSRCRVLVAPVTPMSASGELNLDRVPDLYALLRSRGADGFYLCGGTGEGMLMDAGERMRVVEAWREAVGDSADLFVHVGCASTREARQLAGHAASMGAAAISSVAPPVYAAGDLGQLVKSFAHIAEAAPETPFYYYHNAGSPGVKVTGYDFLTAGADAIPTLAGIKFTHEDLFDLSRSLRVADGRFHIYYGRDEFLLAAHATGAKRFIGGSYNLLMPLVRQVLSSFAAGEMEAAQAAQHQLVDVVAVLRRFGGLSAVKAAMALLGVPCGPVRLPLKPLTASQTEDLGTALRQVWPGMTAPAVSLSNGQRKQPIPA